MAASKGLPAATREQDVQFAPSPAQEVAIASALRAIQAADLVLIEGESGSGRTTVLQALQARLGGKLLTIEDLFEKTVDRHMRRYEQNLYELFQAAFEDHDVVYFDDVDGFERANFTDYYERYGRIGAVLRNVLDLARTRGKRLVVTKLLVSPAERTRNLTMGVSWDDQGVLVKIPAMTAADYGHILEARLGADRLGRLGVEDLFSASGKLSAAQLARLATVIDERELGEPTSAEAIEIVDGEILQSNVKLDEVEAVTLHGMVGIEAVVTRLDRAILLPMRDPELARELRLEPKHGVLIHGPPGTGKTTVGRALAHQMRGKFFMIDGDFTQGSWDFYQRVDKVFEQALRNSPSVIFIDDADVILSDPDMQQFGRYLLTKLDGLQSESAAKVCVMMTAMNLASMPPAMIRSGRLEVWLEMRLPAPEARAALIETYARKLPFDGAVESAEARSEDLVRATEGFTPADLRKLVSDAAGLLGYDRHKGQVERPFADYLSQAANDLGSQKALAEDAISARGGRRYY